MAARIRFVLLAAPAFVLQSAAATAEPPPVAAFARLPDVAGVSISPDGRYIAFLTVLEGRQLVVTLDRRDGKPVPVLTNDERDRFRLSWCNWANDTRLMCGLHAARMDAGSGYQVSRLVAVDADGGKSRILVQNSRAAVAQFQDRVLDWTPDEPRSVLLQVDADGNGYPSVFELDVYTGALKAHTREHSPILDFVSDGRGAVRLGSGYKKADISYFARLEGDDEWRQLAKFKAFSEHDALKPLAVVPGSNKAYATGNYEGRQALWEIDLTDIVEPQVIARHPRVDIEKPMFSGDGQLLGIAYETEKPAVYYLDGRAESVIFNMDKLLPESFNRIVDMSRDEKVYVVHSGSDIDSTYYVVDTTVTPRSVTRVGRAYPELDPAQLGRMQPIEYPATDGTRIPGYLTLPPGAEPKNLPTIVLPHGGPVERDTWGFDFLVQFLVSRGYAVLQMNFRGSDGYGDDWFYAAHQDWGGLTYSDIRDGARWAVAQGIADPERMCIVGWSFGGYAALLGAVRDSGLYRCAASIAGLSDLVQFRRDQRYFLNSRIAELQIGGDVDKLKNDSPRRHAVDVHIPILMVHGTHDVSAEVEQSRLMASALKRAGDKDYELLELEGGDHQLWRPEERTQLLQALETFLVRNLKAHAAPAPVVEALEIEIED
ncbi:MAG: prolyl oligopeptidase family serine peptidase [Panacagrimonas sp.]